MHDKPYSRSPEVAGVDGLTMHILPNGAINIRRIIDQDRHKLQPGHSTITVVCFFGHLSSQNVFLN